MKPENSTLSLVERALPELMKRIRLPFESFGGKFSTTDVEKTYLLSRERFKI